MHKHLPWIQLVLSAKSNLSLNQQVAQCQLLLCLLTVDVHEQIIFCSLLRSRPEKCSEAKLDNHSIFKVNDQCSVYLLVSETKTVIGV